MSVLTKEAFFFFFLSHKYRSSQMKCQMVLSNEKKCQMQQLTYRVLRVESTETLTRAPLQCLQRCISRHIQKMDGISTHTRSFDFMLPLVHCLQVFGDIMLVANTSSHQRNAMRKSQLHSQRCRRCGCFRSGCPLSLRSN